MKIKLTEQQFRRVILEQKKDISQQIFADNPNVELIDKLKDPENKYYSGSYGTRDKMKRKKYLKRKLKNIKKNWQLWG